MWLLFLVLNLAISWANAWTAGTTWYEANRGWPWLVKWSTAIMSAIGFTWCTLQVGVRVAVGAGLLEPKLGEMSLMLGYMVILPALLVTSVVITIEAIRQAWRTKRFSDTAVAFYDVGATVYNVVEAVRFLPDFLHEFGESVGDSLTDADDPTDFVVGGLFFGALLVATFIVVLALGLGIMLTKLIIGHYQKKTVHDRAWRIQHRPKQQA